MCCTRHNSASKQSSNSDELSKAEEPHGDRLPGTDIGNTYIYIYTLHTRAHDDHIHIFGGGGGRAPANALSSRNILKVFPQRERRLDGIHHSVRRILPAR